MDYEEYLNKERTIAELIEENKELKSTIKELHCKLDELEKSKKDAEKYLAELIEENKELKKEVSKLKSYLNHVRNTLNGINDEMRIIIMQE